MFFFTLFKYLFCISHSHSLSSWIFACSLSIQSAGRFVRKVHSRILQHRRERVGFNRLYRVLLLQKMSHCRRHLSGMYVCACPRDDTHQAYHLQHLSGSSLTTLIRRITYHPYHTSNMPMSTWALWASCITKASQIPCEYHVMMSICGTTMSIPCQYNVTTLWLPSDDYYLFEYHVNTLWLWDFVWLPCEYHVSTMQYHVNTMLILFEYHVSTMW